MKVVGKVLIMFSNQKTKRIVNGEVISFWYDNKGVVVAKQIVLCAPNNHQWDRKLGKCARCSSTPEEVLDDTWQMAKQEVPW